MADETFEKHLPKLHGHVLGRRYAPDARDRKYPMRPLLPMSVTPVSKYWQVGPILDQGDTPMCVGYASEQFLQSEPLLTMDGPSPKQIYDAAQKLDEWPGEGYDGTSVRGAAKALTEMGRLQSYVWGADALDARDWLILKGPVIMGTDWLTNMFDPAQDGTLRVNGSLAGGHAYLLVGYDAPNNRFKMVNSWGGSWGLSGTAWIKYRDLDKLIARHGEACAAVEQKVNPAA